MILRRHIHKRTIYRGEKEETQITETTHVEQDEKTPEELKDSIQNVVDQFLAGKDPGHHEENTAGGEDMENTGGANGSDGGPKDENK